MQSFLRLIIISSANPDKSSMTIKGILLQYVAVMLTLGTLAGIPLMESEVVKYIEMASLAAGALLTLFGLTRKLYYQIKSV